MNVFASLLAQTGGGRALDTPNVEYFLILPELLLVGGALLLLLVSSLFRERPDPSVYATYTLIVGAATLLATWFIWQDVDENGVRSAVAGAIVRDHYSLFFVVVITVALILGAFMAADWLRAQRIDGPEFFVLAMLSSSGGVLMASANDLIVVFLALEILSLALYVMAGFNRRREQSREAALKYFLLGAFSSAIFLYGVALVYGATGSTNLEKISQFLTINILLDDGLLLAGAALMIVGLGFKVAAVPFHQWTPDVYDGSPSPVVGFMAAAAKAAGFAALLRIFGSTLFSIQLDWKPIILVLAVLTLFLGSIAACVQRNVKRMMAYSSIAHAGYVLLGLYVVTEQGMAAALFYLLAYTFMIIGTFAVITLVGGRDDDNHDLEAYRGLGARNPVLAVSLAILLVAQTGIPLTSGFVAKFYVIRALAEEGYYVPAVLAMLAAAIAAFFYLRIIVVMYAGAPETETAGAGGGSYGEGQMAGGPAASEGHGSVAVAEAPAEGAVDVSDESAPVTDTLGPIIPAGTWIALAVALVATVAMGVLPQSILDPIDFATKAASDLFG